MDRRKETGFVVIVGIVIMLAIALGALCSCGTRKVVTEYVAVHDTLHAYHTDTIRDVKVVSHTDTISRVEWHTLTLDAGGDTIREVHHYYDRERTIIVDSTDRYRAERDSLRAALRDQSDKSKTVVKTRHLISWWEWVLMLGIVGTLAWLAVRNKS